MQQYVCSLCGGEELADSFLVQDFDFSNESFELQRCARCALGQTAPMPDQATLERYYSGSYYGSGVPKFTRLVEFITVLACRIRAKNILRHISKSQADSIRLRVLDIGCGRANLLQRLNEMGCECTGTERGEFPVDSRLDGITILRGSLDELNFKDRSFDAVILWHVLEHLRRPFETLDEIGRITDKAGIVAIAVPNFSSLQARWFKSKWFHLDIPRHLFHFDVENLSKALEKRGFTIQSVSTCSTEQNVFGFIQSLMNHFVLLGKPNRFYQLLKHSPGILNKFKLGMWALIALLILPLAILEFIVSCFVQKGATIKIFAQKS